MIVYRIAQQQFINDLSGYGAYLYGGRWSSRGTFALYTASFRSLAYLEYVVHQFGKPDWPSSLKIATIEFDEKTLIKLEEKNLPNDWNQLTYSFECQLIASEHFQPAVIGVSVPSVIVKEERNIILNPLSEAFGQKVKILTIENLEVDPRFR